MKINTKQERRSNYPMPENEMYNISDVKRFIDKERRHDELDRFNEVRLQKQVWLKTVLFCLALHLAVVTLGLIGFYYK